MYSRIQDCFKLRLYSNSYALNVREFPYLGYFRVNSVSQSQNKKGASLPFGQKGHCAFLLYMRSVVR